MDGLLGAVNVIFAFSRSLFIPPEVKGELFRHSGCVSLFVLFRLGFSRGTEEAFFRRHIRG